MQNTQKKVLEQAAKTLTQYYKTNNGKEGIFAGEFICLPDPENIMEWYYIVCNLQSGHLKGGFYMGYIKNMQDYITSANTLELPKSHIIQFLYKMRPEAWNKAWKQT